MIKFYVKTIPQVINELAEHLTIFSKNFPTSKVGEDVTGKSKLKLLR